jgi:hypothetical protein
MSVSTALAKTLLVIAVLAVGGCAAATIRSYGDRGIDLQRYRTFNWASATAFSTGDPRLDNNEFFANRVRTQVESELTKRHFEKTTGDRPDLLVHYHASVTQDLDVRTIDRDYRDSATARYEPYVFDAGTLFVDLVDPSTNRLVWRGWAEANIEGVIDDQRLLEQRIDEAVTRILDRLPPRLAAAAR